MNKNNLKKLNTVMQKRVMLWKKSLHIYIPKKFSWHKCMNYLRDIYERIWMRLKIGSENERNLAEYLLWNKIFKNNHFE